jgi:hypothetical protein
VLVSAAPGITHAVINFLRLHGSLIALQKYFNHYFMHSRIIIRICQLLGAVAVKFDGYATGLGAGFEHYQPHTAGCDQPVAVISYLCFPYVRSPSCQYRFGRAAQRSGADGPQKRGCVLKTDSAFSFGKYI